MLTLACLWLLASATSVQLVDEVYRIPANEWRYVDLGLNQQAAMVLAEYRVDPDTQQVRLALMRRDDAERLRAGAPHGIMSNTPHGQTGVMAYRVPGPGEYVVVVDNRGRPAANVHLRIKLDFSVLPPTMVVRRLSPGRQLTVIALSCAFFFSVVTYSARRLLKGLRR